MKLVLEKLTVVAVLVAFKIAGGLLFSPELAPNGHTKLLKSLLKSSFFALFFRFKENCDFLGVCKCDNESKFKVIKIIIFSFISHL